MIDNSHQNASSTVRKGSRRKREWIIVTSLKGDARVAASICQEGDENRCSLEGPQAQRRQHFHRPDRDERWRSAGYGVGDRSWYTHFLGDGKAVLPLDDARL